MIKFNRCIVFMFLLSISTYPLVAMKSKDRTLKDIFMNLRQANLDISHDVFMSYFANDLYFRLYRALCSAKFFDRTAEGVRQIIFFLRNNDKDAFSDINSNLYRFIFNKKAGLSQVEVSIKTDISNGYEINVQALAKIFIIKKQQYLEGFKLAGLNPSQFALAFQREEELELAAYLLVSAGKNIKRSDKAKKFNGIVKKSNALQVEHKKTNAQCFLKLDAPDKGISSHFQKHTNTIKPPINKCSKKNKKLLMLFILNQKAHSPVR